MYRYLHLAVVIGMLTGCSFLLDFGNRPAELQISNKTLDDAIAGRRYAAMLTAVGGKSPYTWSLLTAPTELNWLALDAKTGELSGRPSALAGATSFTVEVIDSRSQTATKLLTIMVRACSTGASPSNCGEDSLTCCLGVCADLQSDPANCSACGHACPAPENAAAVCKGGTCDFICNTGCVLCGGACFEEDLGHCGAACESCASTLADNCTGGTCRCGTNAPCSGSNVCCGGACTDTRSDVNNCGRCSLRCLGGDKCSNSKCMADLEWANWKVPPEAPPVGNYVTDTLADTVTDQVTGLVWQKTVPIMPCMGDGKASDCTQAQAIAYCASLNDSQGQPGWRLPTRIELLSIVDSSTTNPAINTKVFSNTPVDSFWTSSAYAGSTPLGWSVEFYYGGDLDDIPGLPHKVRCVR